MSFTRIYGLFLRHFYLITRSFPRVLDLIYWPTIQITLWGFISNFFATHHESRQVRLPAMASPTQIMCVRHSLCVCVCVYMHSYIHACMHTYIHTNKEQCSAAISSRTQQADTHIPIWSTSQSDCSWAPPPVLQRPDDWLYMVLHVLCVCVCACVV